MARAGSLQSKPIMAQIGVGAMGPRASSTAALPAGRAGGGEGEAGTAAWAAGSRFEQGEQHRPA